MHRQFILFALFISPFSIQEEALDRHVVRSHSNGAPYVVAYTRPFDQERVKEELYYDNGNLDYVGHYKRGQEHGEWVYYWENGNVKSYEYYINGREEGEHYECNELGEKVKVSHYRKGVLIREELMR